MLALPSAGARHFPRAVHRTPATFSTLHSLAHGSSRMSRLRGAMPRITGPFLSLRNLRTPSAAKGSAAVVAETPLSTRVEALTQWLPLTTEAGRRPVGFWLLGAGGVVVSMVILGGVTRLTHSGLSMTEWKPLTVWPPTSEAEWEVEFQKYQQFPEFYKLHPDMTLDKFKPIFWYEYSHRMLGRALGVIFAIPAAYFGLRGYITSALAPRLGLLFCAGGAQGFIGWWMVKSGLEDLPTGDDGITRVSPYRLATHLTSAFAIYTTIMWTGMSVLQRVPKELCDRELQGVLRLRAFSKPMAVLIGVTAVSGAYVAGMKAGHHFNTFPLMDGKIVPEDYLAMTPIYRNFFENIPTVQFDHRLLATCTFTSSWAFWAYSRMLVLPRQVRLAANLVVAATSGQFALGILTLLSAVPVHLGAAHQGGALTVFTTTLFLLHTLRLRSPTAARRMLAQPHTGRMTPVPSVPSYT